MWWWALTGSAASDPAEQIVLDHLAALGVDHTVVRIDPAFANTAAFCQEYGYTMDGSANCIVVAAKSGPPQYVACLVQATRRLDVNGTVRRLMGVRKASFAPAEQTVQLTGMLPDGVTPFGLPEDMALYVDAPIMDLGRVIVGGGSRSLKLEVAPAAFTAIAAAQVIEGLSKAPA